MTTDQTSADYTSDDNPTYRALMRDPREVIMGALSYSLAQRPDMADFERAAYLRLRELVDFAIAEETWALIVTSDDVQGVIGHSGTVDGFKPAERFTVDDGRCGDIDPITRGICLLPAGHDHSHEVRFRH